MSELPQAWIKCAIGEVTKIVAGGTPHSKDNTNFANEGGIPWLTPSDLSGYKQIYIARGSRNLTEKGFSACSAIMLPKDSVLFSSRAPIGYVAITENEMCTNQGFKSFVLPDGINNHFLYYYLKHIKPTAELMATGTTFKELSGSATAKLPLILPPHNEQRRIADKLNNLLARIDFARERLDRIPKILKQFRRSVLAAATNGVLTENWRSYKSFSDISIYIESLKILKNSRLEKMGGKKSEFLEESAILDIEMPEIPCEWSYVPLSSLSVRVTYGLTVRPAYVETGVPVISAKEIRSGNVDYELANLISLDDYKIQREKCKIFKGDLLFSKTGSIGHVAIANRDILACSSQNIAVITSLINEKYLECVFRSPYIQDLAKKKAMGNAVADLQLGILSQFPIPLPSAEEQNEIVCRVEKLFSFAGKIEARYKAAREKVDKLTPALLSKAFRGELVEQDPNDEPAEKLLERIKANKKTATPAKKSPMKKTSKRK